jgi:ADP-ribose pyrophosphatase
MTDYVTVVAVSTARELVLVRQFRPAVERFTLELPSGHVDPGERPEESAQRELREETGFAGGHLELTGVLAPDTGRLGNRLWCFLATDVGRAPGVTATESGIDCICEPVTGIPALIANSRLDHALNIAALMLATQRRPDLFA